MRDTSSPGAETHNDCVSGATLVKRFANSLEVAGSVGRCAPTDPDHFLAVRLAVAISQQRRIRDRCPFWHTIQNYVQYLLVLDVGHYTHERNVPIFGSDGISAIAYYSKSEVSRFRHRKGPWVLDLLIRVVLVDDMMTNLLEPVSS